MLQPFQSTSCVCHCESFKHGNTSAWRGGAMLQIWKHEKKRGRAVLIYKRWTRGNYHHFSHRLLVRSSGASLTLFLRRGWGIRYVIRLNQQADLLWLQDQHSWSAARSNHTIAFLALIDSSDPPTSLFILDVMLDLNSWLTTGCRGGKAMWICHSSCYSRGGQKYKSSVSAYFFKLNGVKYIYFRLSVRRTGNRSVFTQQWPSEGSTQLQRGRRKQRTTLHHKWLPKTAALTAPTCSVFLLPHADLNVIWPWKQCSLILLLLFFPQFQMTFMHSMQRSLISSEIQIRQCRLMNFNYCRSRFPCTGTFQSAVPRGTHSNVTAEDVQSWCLVPGLWPSPVTAQTEQWWL